MRGLTNNNPNTVTDTHPMANLIIDNAQDRKLGQKPEPHSRTVTVYGFITRIGASITRGIFPHPAMASAKLPALRAATSSTLVAKVHPIAKVHPKYPTCSQLMTYSHTPDVPSPNGSEVAPGGMIPLPGAPRPKSFHTLA